MDAAEKLLHNAGMKTLCSSLFFTATTMILACSASDFASRHFGFENGVDYQLYRLFRLTVFLACVMIDLFFSVLRDMKLQLSAYDRLTRFSFYLVFPVALFGWYYAANEPSNL